LKALLAQSLLFFYQVKASPAVDGGAEQVVLMGEVAGFWIVSLLLVMVPGADWAYAITAGLRDRSVIPAVAGLLTGYVALTAVVAAGVAALVGRWPLLLTGLTALGALYLLWLGATTLARPAAPAAVVGGGAQPWLRRAAKGAGISGLNPKGLLLFLALLPQFTSRGTAWLLAAQIMLLGLVHTASCGVVYTGVGTAARRVLRARPAIATAITRFSGAAMIVVGILLLAERLLA
jgi:threonine/homoserine/homoserine lactone efflux protein